MRIGVIGLGARMMQALHTGASGFVDVLRKYDNDFELTAVTDIRNEQIKKDLEEKGISSNDVMFFTEAEEMLSSVKLDGVIIGTFDSLHTEMALKVIPKGLPLFLEKPVSTSIEDLIKLRDADRKYQVDKNNVICSFPLRFSKLAELAKEIIDSGKIGTVEHVQAVQNVPYGGIFYHRKNYRERSKTNGLFLQKATHDFDVINFVLGIKPVLLCAMTARQVFKGDRPENLLCTDCNEIKTCMDSPMNLKINKIFQYETTRGDYCCFSEIDGNEDSGSVIIQYETGMHAVYTQNFVVRKNAGQRNIRMIGYKGTLEFDFHTNTIKVYMHHTPRVEDYKVIPEEGGHYGGDPIMARHFIDVMNGEESKSPLKAGILSALMCIKANESATSKEFKEVKWPDE